MTIPRGKRRFAALLIATVVIFGSLLGGSVGAYGYWSSPQFCHSCHIMDPYCESWARSSHKDVACVQCHFEPGIENELRGKWVAIKQLASVVTGAYSPMPYAEVSDASCLRSGCHSTEELEKPVAFSDREITFDHRQHTGEMRRGIKLTCTSCHNQRLQTTHLELDESTCFLCHFKEAESGGKDIGECGSCHGPPQEVRQVAGFAVDHASYAARGMRCVQCHEELTTGTGAVGIGRCYSCHNEPEKIAQFDNPGLLHVEHVTAEKKHCYECHDLIHHSLEHGRALAERPETGGSCASCHESSHSAQAQVYAGRGAKGAPPLEDGMHAIGLDCIGCHRAGAKTAGNGDAHAQAFGPGEQSCSSCHGERYEEFVVQTKANLDEMLSHLGGRSAAVREKMEGASAEGRLIDRAVYRAATQAEHDLELLQRAGPMHNPLYAVSVLRSARDAIESAEAGVEIAFDGDLPFGFEPEDCGVCHDSLPDPGELSFAGKLRFPHATHVEKTGLGCTDCHAGEQHPPRAPTSENGCKACHQDDMDKIRQR